MQKHTNQEQKQYYTYMRVYTCVCMQWKIHFYNMKVSLKHFLAEALISQCLPIHSYVHFLQMKILLWFLKIEFFAPKMDGFVSSKRKREHEEICMCMHVYVYVYACMHALGIVHAYLGALDVFWLHQNGGN